MVASSYTDEQLCSVWTKCLDEIKNEVSSAEFESFIKPINLEDISDNVAYFTVPGPFYLDQIEKKYYAIIKRIIMDCTKNYLNLQFYEQEKFPKVRESALKASNFDSHLNKQYTFDSFIVGNSNRMACAAAVAIADSPGNAYNPFFIYGQSGLGKTHLMHAIGNKILENDPTKKVLYVTSETFTNEFVDAITHKTNEEFRNKYRNIDVLLIDDIQFLSKMERTQEEFFYTFNALYEAKHQIVISCDSPISKLEVLEDRLRTRFAWGLIADVQAPDYETKVAILNRKAEEKAMEVESEILDYIASYTGDNIRELEGVINHLSIALHQGQEISINLAKEALKHISDDSLHEITEGVIIDSVSRYFSLSVEDLLSKKRTKELVLPRQIAMYLCRTLLDMSYPNIGKAFNGKDHSTVMYAVEQVSGQVETNPELRKTMDELKKYINSGVLR
ncbi:MAG: chromosomal replication initiator protein DnaA [Clostridia bacterium]|nr:chromosomal replication initiator protein DnaA [Clostridia bacterium]MBR7063211.1 chromosomal replication initiator protein DnaA [Clostridia bacterium]